MHQEKGKTPIDPVTKPNDLFLPIERIKNITRENRKMIDRIVEIHQNETNSPIRDTLPGQAQSDKKTQRMESIHLRNRMIEE